MDNLKMKKEAERRENNPDCALMNTHLSFILAN